MSATQDAIRRKGYLSLGVRRFRNEHEGFRLLRGDRLVMVHWENDAWWWKGDDGKDHGPFTTSRLAFVDAQEAI